MNLAIKMMNKAIRVNLRRHPIYLSRQELKRIIKLLEKDGSFSSMCLWESLVEDLKQMPTKPRKSVKK